MAEVETAAFISATNNCSSSSPEEHKMGQKNEKMVEETQESKQKSSESETKEISEFTDIKEESVEPVSEKKIPELPSEADKINEELSKMENEELPSVEDELMKLFKEVAESNGIQEVTNVTEEVTNATEEVTKNSDENGKQQDEEAGLLDECESPKEVERIDENSNGISSNDDEESNQNGGEASEHDNELSNQNGGEISEHDNEDTKESSSLETAEPENDKKAESIIDTPVEEAILLPPNSINNDESREKPVEEEATEKEEPPSLDLVSPEAKNDTVAEDIEMQPIKQELELNITDEIKLEEPIVETDDVEMTAESDVVETKNEEEIKAKMEMDSPDDQKKTDDTKVAEDLKVDEIEEQKEETIVAEKPITSEPVRFSFMKKYATSFGKLSRGDLEELLLEKITESLVYRSHCADLRIMYEKQEEQVDHLKKRLATVTKQYNDLEMIHKRVEKDLKERHDGTVQPVRITRAVGLQVFLEQRNSNNQNLNTSQNSLLKQKSSAGNSTSTQNKNYAFKRSNEVTPKHNTEPDAKRKKSAKTTPLRPQLSEKEETCLKLQEASIEQSLRAKITKAPPPMPASLKAQLQSASPAAVQNGNKSLLKPLNSASIDLTDDVDEIPSERVTNPPALVAINRSQITQNPQIRPIILKSNPIPSRTPNMPFRSESLRSNLASIYKHPAPLPHAPPQIVLPGSRRIPPRPNIKINNVQNGIIVSWTVEGLNPDHADILCYQIYAYEETNSPPSSENWKHVGDVKALLLPMAVTLTQFQEGQKYFFAVRAVDIYKRLGQFSLPKTWN